MTKPILLVSTCKEKLNENEFVEPHLTYLKEKSIEAVVVHYSKIKKNHLQKAGKIIICGTALADNDYLEHLDKFKWIKNSDKPTIGICSGAQIVASVFGAKIKKNFEIGMVKVKGNLFGKKEFDAYCLHQNGLANLEKFTILAESDKSVQAIKHKTKQIFGVTFHPEVRNMWVIDSFLGIV